MNSTWDNCNYQFVRKEEKEKEKLVSASIDKRDTRPRAEKLNWLSKVAPKSHARPFFFFCRPDKNPTSYFVLSILKPSAFSSSSAKLCPWTFVSSSTTFGKKNRGLYISLYLSLSLSFARVLSLSRNKHTSVYPTASIYQFFIYIFIYIIYFFSHIYIHFLFYINNSVLDAFFVHLHLRYVI